MPKLPSLINIPKMYRPLKALYYYIVPGGTFLGYTMHSNSRQVNLTQTVLEKLDDYFTGEINEIMELFNFNKRNQAMDKNVDSYVTCLRTLAKTCNFCDTCGDSLIRGRIIIGNQI